MIHMNILITKEYLHRTLIYNKHYNTLFRTCTHYSFNYLEPSRDPALERTEP